MTDIREALAELVDANAQATPEFLAFLVFFVGGVEGGDVEDVGVVPTNTQSGVRKNKL
jgi:hypothetical protein